MLAGAMANAADFELTGKDGTTILASEVTTFDEPWAMTFLPDGTMLVTTKPGKLFHVTQQGEKTEVGGVWEVAYGGQGGLGDVVLHPGFAENNLVYLSYAETLDNGATFGAAVARAELDRSGSNPRLANIEKIWTQEPKVPGRGHYSHRMAFGTDGKLFITSGDRQKQRPAQDLDKGLGKIIRLNDDGTVPDDNPWQDAGDLARTYWSMGHRNLLGIDFDGEGRLWAHEMGPRHGDELNLIIKGNNYGWPLVSNGDNYSGVEIPDHDTDPRFNPPEAYWVPAISPAGFVIYDGDMFAEWRGDGFIGGLSSRALVRVDMDGESAREAERFEWGKRIREVEQGPDGALWVLEDQDGARLLRLTPKR
jgi:glucose/arabinose dehydrogenase